jgi:ketosteroid isomerase-like protein
MKGKRRLPKAFFAAAALVAIGAVCAVRVSSGLSAEDELMQADRAFDAATAKQGLNGLLGFIADDMTTIRPNEPIVRGKDAFGAGWKNLLSTPGLTIRWKPDLAAVSRSGDLGYTVGAYEVTRTDDAGLPHLSGSGKYITIWRKQTDGSWKVVFDSGVQDRLPPGTPAPKP